MKFVAFASTLNATLFELFQQTWSDSSVNQIVCQMTKIRRKFHVRSQFDATQTAKMLEIIGRKCPDPTAQFLGKKLLELFLQVATWSFILKSSRFVDKRNNPNLCQRADQHVRHIG